jgi:hypothetical protein
MHSRSRSGLDRGTIGFAPGLHTYSDSDWKVLFIQDASGGIFVELSGNEFPANGQSVVVMGQTGAGSFRPVVQAATCRPLGPEQMPSPRRIRRLEPFVSEIDCEWSEFVGVVRRAEPITNPNHARRHDGT